MYTKKILSEVRTTVKTDVGRLVCRSEGRLKQWILMLEPVDHPPPQSVRSCHLQPDSCVLTCYWTQRQADSN